jgi:mitochondrial import inner membrane translocase subunit TIM23
LASIPTSAFGVYIGPEYFGSGDIDPTQMILGFDPFLMNAGFVMGCGILGWLVGPTYCIRGRYI